MINSYFDIHDVCLEEEKVPVTFLVSSFNIGRAIGVAAENKSNNIITTHSGGNNKNNIDISRNSSSNNDKYNTKISRNNSSNVSEVPSGSKVLLPLWAAIALRKKAYVQVSLPNSFSHSSFRQFKMDPLVPNLYIMSPYYYELGLLLCRLIGNPPLSAITVANAANNANSNNNRRRAWNESNDDNDNTNNNNTREMTLVNVLGTEGRRLASQLFRLYQLRYLRVILSSAKCGFDRADVREKLCEMERELFDAVLKGKAEEHIWRDRLIEKEYRKHLQKIKNKYMESTYKR